MKGKQNAALALALLHWMDPTAFATQKGTGWDVTEPRGKTRVVDFVTDEGTWMSVDISPDGRFLVFDLLGHVYRVPSTGGEAENLTAESGIAVNHHPRFSPDGLRIAFVSDRAGQDNLWVMEGDGSNPHAVFDDPWARVSMPKWTPDGSFVIVDRTVLDESLVSRRGFWMQHVDGGPGVSLFEGERAAWPSLSSDGRYLYFHQFSGESGSAIDTLSGSHQLRRLELRSGNLVSLTSGVAQKHYRSSSGGAYAPEVSPDGRWLAFARRIPDGLLVFKGHKIGPRTALWLRDLESGTERLLMDPIEMDLAETGATAKVLPGYAWSKDGKTIVIAQGGRIRRVEIATGEVSTIPFTARVHREISEKAKASFRITDGPFRPRIARWMATSPDRRTLLFESTQRLWLMDLPGGTPRRLTDPSFQPLELSPAWSPDGFSIAFTTWSDEERGHLWRIPASGGTPVRITNEPGEYLNPTWSPDGKSLFLARGAGATAHGRTWVSNYRWDIVRVPASGGAAESIAVARDVENAYCGYFDNARCHIVRPQFGPGGRVYFVDLAPPESGAAEASRVRTALVSVEPDGSDRRVHMTFPFAEEAVPSPDSRFIAFQEGDNVYLTPFPSIAAGTKTPHMEKREGTFPVTRVSRTGGLLPRWRDAKTLEYSSGMTHYRYRLDDRETESTSIRLELPRDIPRGTLKLEGARVITLDTGKVIEEGDILVNGSRITCVGDCSGAAADRVIDVRGKTIVPGFVDMHAHHYHEHRGIIPVRNFEQAIYLAYGVTTSFENWTWAQGFFPVADLIDAGVSIGPRSYSTGDPLDGVDDARDNVVKTYADAEAEVQKLASWGVTGLKQYLMPRRAERQWVSEAARKLGLMVTAEVGDLYYSLGMVMDGHTGFEHALDPILLYSDVTRFLGRAGVVYSPTFVVSGLGPTGEEYFFQREDVWKDAKLRRFMPWRQLVPHTRRRWLRPETDYAFPIIAQAMADVIAEGGLGAIGSHGEQHGIASHWEVWMASSALGPMGALEVASLHGARFLGAEEDLGSLTVGKLADLMVLDANPLDDIRNTARIDRVMKGGVLYDADTLDEVWPRERPFGAYPWVESDMLRMDERGTDYWDRRKP